MTVKSIFILFVVKVNIVSLVLIKIVIWIVWGWIKTLVDVILYWFGLVMGQIHIIICFLERIFICHFWTAKVLKLFLWGWIWGVAKQKEFLGIIGVITCGFYVLTGVNDLVIIVCYRISVWCGNIHITMHSLLIRRFCKSKIFTWIDTFKLCNLFKFSKTSIWFWKELHFNRVVKLFVFCLIIALTYLAHWYWNSRMHNLLWLFNWIRKSNWLSFWNKSN